MLGNAVGGMIFFKVSNTVPEYVKFEGPLPSLPSVMIYPTVISVPFSNFLPKTPSPNNNSYFWS